MYLKNYVSEHSIEARNKLPIWEFIVIIQSMHIISRRRLVAFWTHHPKAEQPLKAWYAETKKAHWGSPSEIKNIYANASSLRNNRVVFNISGNDYRLVVVVIYKFGKVYIRFVGTHQEYDRIDATTI